MNDRGEWIVWRVKTNPNDYERELRRELPAECGHYLSNCDAQHDAELWAKAFGHEYVVRHESEGPPTIEKRPTYGTAATPTDAVSHPPHYTSHPSGIECIQVTEHMNFNRGNAVKYIWRAGLKTDDPVKDLKKARWYIDRELARLEKSGESRG